MGGGAQEVEGPDLQVWTDARQLEDGATLRGHVGEEAVLLVRRGFDVFAVGATCTHYGGPLADGVVEGGKIHCPWHHACFDVATGEAIAAPALRSLPCWNVERQGDQLRVTTRRAEVAAPKRTAPAPRAIVVVGGGAAGHASAEMLRRLGYDGELTILSADADAPCDRPNLSKDYLAGNAPEEWIPLRPPEFFGEQRIDLVLSARVSELDLRAKRAVLADGRTYAFDALLLATGADPVRPSIPGADQPHVHYLRSLADSRAIIAKLGSVRRVAVIGAGFIGLEVAASLRTRGIDVDVIDPARNPLEHAIGPALGAFVRSVHEEHGVRFHLGQSAARIEAGAVTLSGGAKVAADLVVIGVGVRPDVGVAQRAGLAVDDGIVVDEFLRTSAPDVFAAGDVARVADGSGGRGVRVEHWVVAQRQGQVAARNLLGERASARFPPFFWSQHYDVSISVVGHTAGADRVELRGDLKARDATVLFQAAGRTRAVATIGRDQESLRAEMALDRGDDAARALAAAAR